LASSSVLEEDTIMAASDAEYGTTDIEMDDGALGLEEGLGDGLRDSMDTNDGGEYNNGGDDNDNDNNGSNNSNDDEDGPNLASEGGATDTPMAEWSEDMVQTEEMEKLGICINLAAKVVVCLDCRSAIKPSNLSSHIIKVHPPMKTDSAFCEGLETKYGLNPSPFDTRPGRIIPAIYGLDLIEGFVTCDTCGYACSTDERMKRHFRGSDGCETSQARCVQTFRPRSRRFYFGVDHASTAKPVDDPLDPVVYLKKKFAPPPFSSIPITSPKTARDAHHFLNSEHWDEYVQGKNGADIYFAVRERDAELRGEVRTCVERYVEAAVKDLKSADNEPRAVMGDYLG
jgi:hypothetical protein